jgi:hypothetical protein
MLSWVVIDRRHLRQSPRARFIRALPLPASPLSLQLLTSDLPLCNVPTFKPSNLQTLQNCSNSFSCNTYGTPRKCCKQKTYGPAKPFSCNTYKKQGGAPSSQKSSSPCSTLPPFGGLDLRTFQRASISTCFHLASHLPYALPSSVSCNSLVCRSYENCRGVYQQFPFWNALTPPATILSKSRCHTSLATHSSSFFSTSCALFCIFLHPAKTQLVSFQTFPHSLPKTTRVGGGGRYAE